MAGSRRRRQAQCPRQLERRAFLGESAEASTTCSLLAVVSRRRHPARERYGTNGVIGQGPWSSTSVASDVHADAVRGTRSRGSAGADSEPVP